MTIKNVNKMSFYLKPPRGLINLHTFQDCVEQRLNCYNTICTNNDRIEVCNINCLVEDNPLDRVGHYLFRLYACFNAGFRQMFLDNEKKLLLLRLICYDKEDIKYFLKRAINHSRECLNENNIHQTLKEIYIFLIYLCSQMLNQDYLNQIAREVQIDPECEELKVKGR